MKKTLLFGVFLIAIQATAQVPDYFSNNPEWRLVRAYESGYFGCGVQEDMVYYINGDSTIGDTVYQKLFKRGVASEIVIIPDPDVFCSGSWLFNHLAALIRQENKKIIMRNEEGDEEMYYDFDLVVGDTVPLTIVLPFANRPTINAIDSVWVGDNYFKRFYFVDNTSTYFFIEGIGHIYGFIEPLDIFSGFYSELYCYARNDSVVHIFDNGEWACDFTVSVQEQKNTEFGINLFPNPNTGLINIDLGSLTDVSIKVLNLNGQLIYYKENINTPIYQFELEAAPGIYILELSTEGEKQQFKLIKQ